MKFNQEDVEVLSRRVGYHGFFRIEVYELRHKMFRGGWSGSLSRELFDRGEAAAVLLYDPAQDVLVMVEQFRVGALADDASPWLLELVAGIIEPDEEPADVAKREVREEAGADAKQLEPIYQYYVSPGGCNEKIHLFYGEIDSTGVGGVYGLADEGEDIMVHVITREQALKWLHGGQITNAQTIIALQWLEAKLLREQSPAKRTRSKKAATKTEDAT